MQYHGISVAKAGSGRFYVIQEMAGGKSRNVGHTDGYATEADATEVALGLIATYKRSAAQARADRLRST